MQRNQVHFSLVLLSSCMTLQKSSASSPDQRSERQTYFTSTYLSLGHEYAGISVRYFTAVMGITDVLKATRKKHPAFSKEDRGSLG